MHVYTDPLFSADANFRSARFIVANHHWSQLFGFFKLFLCRRAAAIVSRFATHLPFPIVAKNRMIMGGGCTARGQCYRCQKRIGAKAAYLDVERIHCLGVIGATWYHTAFHGLCCAILLYSFNLGLHLMIPVQPIQWDSSQLYIIDQTELPLQTLVVELSTVEAVWEAIKSLRVRGAPAIGVCAAYGVLIGLRSYRDGTAEAFRARAEHCFRYLATARPTAVNLFYALDCMKAVLDRMPPESSAEACYTALEKEAAAQYDADLAMCQAIGAHGAALIKDGMGILTHCNAGGLATTGYGTALAPLYTAFAQGRRFKVYADETRPLLQGARLTVWELENAGIDVTLICDNMAAVVMRDGMVDAVVVGADRIAANGDTANKIGTYGVAALAHLHNIPFYIAAPASTFDMSAASGADIPIEMRDADEIRRFGTLQTAPESVKTYNPAFDVTPNTYITAFITDRGVIYPPYDRSLSAFTKNP